MVMQNQIRDIAGATQRNLNNALNMAETALSERDPSKAAFAQNWARYIGSQLELLPCFSRLPKESRAQIRTHAESWKRFTVQWEGQPNKDELSKALTILKGEKTKLEDALADILKASE
jgi:hypothetical protein